MMKGTIFMSNETTNKFSLIDLPDVPDSVDSAVKNLTDETTKNVGQTFGDLWYLVFGGISHAADKRQMKYAADLEQYRKELSNSINKIPEEKKVEPSLQTTTQALENSKYCVSSSVLRKMFVNLISGNMNSDLEPLSHPSFPEILKQMDEIDAKLLMEFKSNNQFPIANFLQKTNGETGYKVQFTNAYISNIYKIPLEKCARSLSFLERVGLVKLSYGIYFNDESIYESFKNLDYFKAIEFNLKRFYPNKYLDIQKGICEITPLGIDFINLCVS